jgi:hypothetical protein
MFCRNEGLDLGKNAQFQITVAKKKGLLHYELNHGEFTQSRELKELNDSVHKVRSSILKKIVVDVSGRILLHLAEMEMICVLRKRISIT